MQARPRRLNATIAWLFMVGSACFALGTVPAYANAVGGRIDAVTFFVGSIFFTSASFCQLLQAQTPAMTGVGPDRESEPSRLVVRAWLPKDRNWMAAATQFPGTLFFNISTLAATIHNLAVAQEDRYVWRPDFFGSILFLVASTYALLALPQGTRALRGIREFPGQISWLNMLGSIAFMVSAIASFVLPSTGGLIDIPVANGGTFVGAVCFLVGAALLLPAWRAAVRSAA